MHKIEIIRIVFLCLLCSFFFSCKKKDIPLISPTTSITPVKLPFTEKYYYCQNQAVSSYYSSAQQTISDQIIRCYVENDSLKVLNCFVPITNFNQTVFEYVEHNQHGSISFEIEFFNNYDSISIVSRESNYGGGIKHIMCNGIVTDIREFHDLLYPRRNTLNGLYLLDVAFENDCLGVDTSYTDTVEVSVHGIFYNYVQDSIMVGNYYIENYRRFYSYYEFTDFYNYQEGIYWKDDSLHFHKYTHSNGFCYDTIHYVLQGKKL